MDYAPSISSSLSQHDSAMAGISSSSLADLPVKYTPVTGRISRAIKGVPVHTCDICRPVKAFTRAEHLRRHQLSHQKPAYPCKFEDCERAFHRPDLLARHLHLHENQGEPAYNSGDPRSRASSLERQRGDDSSNRDLSPARIPSPDSSMIVSSPSTMVSSFQAVNQSLGALGSFKRTASQAQLPGAGASILSGNFEQMAFSVKIATTHAGQGTFSTHAQSSFEDMYIENRDEYRSNCTTPQLPLLRIPDLAYTYEDSPWCSSPSGSTYSTPSDSSRISFGVPRIRSQSQVIVPQDWSSKFEPHLSPHIVKAVPQESYSPSIEPNCIEEDTRSILGSRQQFDVPKWGGTYYLKQTQTANNPLCDSQITSATSNTAIGGKEMMKIQNLVSDPPTFLCLIASCPSPCRKFLGRKAQIGHYELFHPALLLRCEFEDCNEHDGVFIAESDRDEHYNSYHRRTSIERSPIIETQKDVGESGEFRCGVEPNSTDHSHLKGRASPEGEIKEDIKIKIEDSTVDSEAHIIQSLTPPISTECHPLPNNSPSSTRSTWRDSSADFETDSNCTEDESDLEEDDISSRHPDIIAMVCKQLQVSFAERSEHLLDPIINPLKESLLERIMGDFWTLFNQEWSENIRRRTASPSTPSSSVSGPSSKRSTEKSNKKHKRTGDDDVSRRRGDDENEDPKRPRHASACPDDDEDSQQKFSCPYRKHNPRKYSHCDRRWRSCALTSFLTIARVKGHLYRNHRIFQCRRCNEVFKDEDTLQNHFMAINPCALQESVSAEGITSTLEKQLRNRKKTSSTQSQEERWQEIYRILFPMEIVPDAFFEPVQDEAVQSPASFELSNYEEFSRQELPRVFRGALEAVINTAAQPLEEQLRSHLVSMIQECQDRVFSSYRTRNSSSPAVSRMALAPEPSIPASISTSSPPADLGNLSTLPGERPKDILDSLYQRPPYQSHSLSNPDLHDRQQALRPARRDETSESGYVSDFSALNTSVSTTQDTGIDLTITNSSSEIQPQTQSLKGHADAENGNTQSLTSYTDDYMTEGLSPRLSEDFSDIYMYGNHSWEAPFLP